MNSRIQSFISLLTAVSSGWSIPVHPTGTRAVVIFCLQTASLTGGERWKATASITKRKSLVSAFTVGKSSSTHNLNNSSLLYA
ncbi:hypothetical protein QL093DRAFT_2371775 [Fusarium oxysporum]|nr:hypothetical protein QL093DRAFT_2371775 [Fusarium oxysporum]